MPNNNKDKIAIWANLLNQALTSLKNKHQEDYSRNSAFRYYLDMYEKVTVLLTQNNYANSTWADQNISSKDCESAINQHAEAVLKSLTNIVFAPKGISIVEHALPTKNSLAICDLAKSLHEALTALLRATLLEQCGTQPLLSQQPSSKALARNITPTTMQAFAFQLDAKLTQCAKEPLIPPKKNSSSDSPPPPSLDDIFNQLFGQYLPEKSQHNPIPKLTSPFLAPAQAYDVSYMCDSFIKELYISLANAPKTSNFYKINEATVFAWLNLGSIKIRDGKEFLVIRIPYSFNSSYYRMYLERDKKSYPYQLWYPGFTTTSLSATNITTIQPNIQAMITARLDSMAHDLSDLLKPLQIAIEFAHNDQALKNQGGIVVAACGENNGTEKGCIAPVTHDWDFNFSEQTKVYIVGTCFPPFGICKTSPNAVIDQLPLLEHHIAHEMMLAIGIRDYANDIIATIQCHSNTNPPRDTADHIWCQKKYICSTYFCGAEISLLEKLLLFRAYGKYSPVANSFPDNFLAHQNQKSASQDSRANDLLSTQKSSKSAPNSHGTKIPQGNPALHISNSYFMWNSEYANTMHPASMISAASHLKPSWTWPINIMLGLSDFAFSKFKPLFSSSTELASSVLGVPPLNFPSNAQPKANKPKPLETKLNRHDRPRITPNFFAHNRSTPTRGRYSSLSALIPSLTTNSFFKALPSENFSGKLLPASQFSTNGSTLSSMPIIVEQTFNQALGQFGLAVLTYKLGAHLWNKFFKTNPKPPPPIILPSNILHDQFVREAHELLQYLKNLKDQLDDFVAHHPHFAEKEMLLGLHITADEYIEEIQKAQRHNGMSQKELDEIKLDITALANDLTRTCFFHYSTRVATYSTKQ